LLAYHGSAITGLRELQPFARPDANLPYPCVYLATHQALAALYIWDKPYKWLNFSFAQDGGLVYTESFPGALNEFYGGLAGSIYTCEGEFEYDENARIRMAMISRVPVHVAQEERVPNALARILQHEREGLLEVRRYETLTAAQLAAEERMIFAAAKRERSPAMQAFMQEKFPAIWEQANIAKGEPL